MKDFLESEMNMQYNYQPVMLLSLLKCPNFTATKSLIRDQLKRYNQFADRNYSEPLREAIIATTATKDRNIISELDGDRIKLNLESMDQDSKNKLIGICYERIAEWDSKWMLTESGTREQIPDSSQIFLLQVSEKGSNEILENTYRYETWTDFESNKRDRVYGEVKPGDILLVYFTNDSVIHSKMVKMVYTVLSVSDDHVELNLRPVKQLAGVHLDTVRRCRESGELKEKFNLIGQVGNITRITREDYLDMIKLDYKSKISVDENIFSNSKSIVKKKMGEDEHGPFSSLSSYLKHKEVEGYKGEILAKAKNIFKNDEDVDLIEKLKEACSQKTVGNLFRPHGGPKASEARMLYALVRGGTEEKALEKQLKLFFRTKKEIEFGTRWDSLVSTINSIKIKEVYPDFLFLSYMAFLQNPQLHIPFTPIRADAIFTLFGIPEKLTKGEKTWQVYSTLLELANELRLKLADSPDLNLIDVQGYMWTLASALEKGIKDDDRVEGVSDSMEPPEDEDICDELEKKGYSELLNAEKQIIFYGPPGTGKTFTAKNVAECFTRFKDDGTPDEFIGRLIDELKMISKVAGYAFEKEGSVSQKMFVMKKGDDEIRVDFHKAVNGDFFMVDAGTKFLTENPDAKNFLIITNERVGSFLCLPYDVEQEYTEFGTGGDGTGRWDPTGKGRHNVHNLKVNMKEAHFEPKKGNKQQKDVSEYLNTWKHLSKDSHFKSTNMARNIYHVTFHPSYSYEDFIEGFRPNVEKDAPAPYFLDRGIFMRACDYARMDENRRIVLIIDEINRGNIPKILGELITLIEKDKRSEEFSLKLTYSKEDFFVPKNLYIIATMNTADKSLMQMDDALKRRFVFEELMPDIGVLVKHLQEKGVDRAEQYANILDRMNKKILGDGLDEKKREQRMKQFRDKQIGHSYFWDIQNDENLQTVIKHSIIPLLQDYFYGDFNEVRKILGEGNDGKDTSIIGVDNRSTKLITDKLKAKDLRDKLLGI